MFSAFRFLAAVFLCFALSGCILQSKEPLFSDAEGELLLAPYGGRFATYSLEGDNWERDEGTIGLIPTAKHYVITEGKTAVSITFAALSGSWFVMQAEETGKPASYTLVDAQKGELLLHPLNCEPLRKSGKHGDAITFDGEDCTIKPGADTAAMFKSLAAEMGPARMKLVPLP